jgi:hypothetical protein
VAGEKRTEILSYCSEFVVSGIVIGGIDILPHRSKTNSLK